MSHPLTGGCACGAVRYELASRPFDTGWCHCRTCQLNSGAPAMVFTGVKRGDFHFTQGGDRVKSFKSSDFGHRLFCGACGTPLAMEVDHEPRTIDISVATLDEPNAVPPEFHIFDESRISWFETADDLPRHARSRPETAPPEGRPCS